MVLPTNDEPGAAWYDTDEPVAIGHGVTILPVWQDTERGMEIVGINEGHIHAEDVDVDPETIEQERSGRRSCGGWVPFQGRTWAQRFADDGAPITAWDVVALDPLTLAPSILCRTCGHHGFITDGKWVPA